MSDDFDVITSTPRVDAAGESSPVEDLVAAAEGDGPARLRVDLLKAQRAEEDERGRLRIAQAKHDTAAAAEKKVSPARLAELREAVGRAQRRVDAAQLAAAAAKLRAERADQVAQQTRDLGGEASPTGRLLRFASAVEFVNEYAVPNWGHPLGVGRAGARWCDQWWLHPSALASLDALWEAFEVMRLAPPPSLASWTRDYLWPFMTELTRPDGPFHSCTPTGSDKRPGHDPEKAWPSGEPPKGYVQTYPSETELLRRGVAAER